MLGKLILIILFPLGVMAQTTAEETTSSTSQSQAPAGEQSQEGESSEETETVTQSETAVTVEQDEDNDSTPARSKVEKIEVTGSHIRRTDIEGPSPVLVIDRERIESSGMNTVSGVLQQSTVSPFGTSSQFPNSVNLKGLGSAKTLVLINGQRAPGTGSSYLSGPVSTDFVPLAAVERIEILKDGASATYGSDALGGVVNIITRKDIDGIAVANQYNMTSFEGGDNNRASFAYGTQTSKSNFMTSAQVTINQGYRLSALDYSGLGLEESRVWATNYQNDSGDIVPAPGCTDLNAFGECADFDRTSRTIEQGYDVDWVTQYSRDLSSGAEFYSTVLLGYSYDPDSLPVRLATPGQGSGAFFTAAESPAAWNSLPGYSGGDIYITHRFDDLINKSIEQTYYGGLVTGVKGYFGNSDWEWDASLNNQINVQTVTEENLGYFPGAQAALSSGAYNPFDASQRDTTGIGIDTFNRNRFMLNWAEFKTNGSLGSLLGFNWAAAAGASAAHFEYADHRAAPIVQGLTMGQSGVIGSAGRELYALFGELSGVIANKFELQFSLRGDLYSDFGETINPKIAARYQPTSWLTLRSSAGTGFQAPTLQDMNTSLEGFFSQQTDYVRCNDPSINDCNDKSFAAVQAANQDLQEETSLSVNFGAIVQPLDNLTVGVDVWMAKVEGVIGTNIDQILRAEADFGPGALGPLGVNLIRLNGDPTGEIQRVEYTLVNQGVQQVEGLDFDAEYKLQTSIGDFTFKDELSYIFHYYQEFISRYGREDIVGRAGAPRWRNNFSIGYQKGEWDALILARSTADMLWDNFAIGQYNPSVVSPTQFDVSVARNFGDIGRFQLGAINIGNIRPRFSASQDIDRSLFRPYTTYYLTYRKDF